LKETGDSLRARSKRSGQADDLAAINGRRDQLEGKIQERYGFAKFKDVDDWLSLLPAQRTPTEADARNTRFLIAAPRAGFLFGTRAPRAC